MSINKTISNFSLGSPSPTAFTPTKSNKYEDNLYTLSFFTILFTALVDPSRTSFLSSFKFFIAFSTIPRDISNFSTISFIVIKQFSLINCRIISFRFFISSTLSLSSFLLPDFLPFLFSGRKPGRTSFSAKDNFNMV